MPAVCCYLQVHQPLRLRKLSYLDTADQYFDDAANKLAIQMVAAKSYIPTCKLLLKMIEKHRAAFRLAISISGVVLEQLKAYAPEAFKLFSKLIKTGAVELMSETYHHSFAVLFDEEEYIYQLKRHSELMEKEFGQKPSILCNSELLYCDRIGQLARRLGYKAVLTGMGHYQLGWRSSNYLYQGRGSDIALFVKNYQLSDDIAFRFSRHDWQEFPLTAEKFATWIHQLSDSSEVVNLFMDFETFGEHHWETSGIFEFLEHFPEHVMEEKEWCFMTPSEVLENYKPVAELPCPSLTSWGAVGADLSSWMGGSLQGNALCALYGLAASAKKSKKYAEVWRNLQVTDNFYYMLGGAEADARVHFSPYANQSDAYINYMNVLRDLEKKLADEVGNTKPQAEIVDLYKRLLGNVA